MRLSTQHQLEEFIFELLIIIFLIPSLAYVFAVIACANVTGCH